MKRTACAPITITLPEATIAMLDCFSDEESRSVFIDEAIINQLKKMERQNLHDQLRDGAIEHAERDLQIARDWAPLEDEVLEKYL